MHSILSWFASCFGLFHGIVALILGCVLTRMLWISSDQVGAIFFIKYFFALLVIFLLWIFGAKEACGDSGMLAIITVTAVFPGIFFLIFWIYAWLKNYRKL